MPMTRSSRTNRDTMSSRRRDTRSARTPVGTSGATTASHQSANSNDRSKGSTPCSPIMMAATG